MVRTAAATGKDSQDRHNRGKGNKASRPGMVSNREGSKAAISAVADSRWPAMVVAVDVPKLQVAV